MSTPEPRPALDVITFGEAMLMLVADQPGPLEPAGCGRVAGFPVTQVIDTVGAGDGFAVGVVSALLEGSSVPEAVKRGAWIGARAVQVLGDTEGLPTRAQLVVAAL